MNNSIEKEQNPAFGYFDDYSETPAYDPGTEINCIVCNKKLSLPLMTISLAIRENRRRSYFYRTHKECYQNMTEEEVTAYESSLIDNL